MLPQSLLLQGISLEHSQQFLTSGTATPHLILSLDVTSTLVLWLAQPRCCWQFACFGSPWHPKGITDQANQKTKSSQMTHAQMSQRWLLAAGTMLMNEKFNLPKKKMSVCDTAQQVSINLHWKHEGSKCAQLHPTRVHFWQGLVMDRQQLFAHHVPGCECEVLPAIIQVDHCIHCCHPPTPVPENHKNKKVDLVSSHFCQHPDHTCN